MEFKKIYTCKCGRYSSTNYDINNNSKCESCGSGCNRLSMYESIAPVVADYKSRIKLSNRANKNKALITLSKVPGLCKSIDWKMQDFYCRKSIEIDNAVNNFLSVKEKWKMAVRSYNKRYGASVIAASPGHCIPEEIADMYDELSAANAAFNDVSGKYYDSMLEAIKSIDEYKEVDDIISTAENYISAINKDNKKYHLYLYLIKEMQWMNYYTDTQYDAFIKAASEISDADDDYLKLVLESYDGRDNYISHANWLKQVYDMTEHYNFPSRDDEDIYTYSSFNDMRNDYLYNTMEASRKFNEEQRREELKRIEQNRKQAVIRDISYMLSHSPLREIDPWGADISREYAEGSIISEIEHFGYFKCTKI